MKCATSLACARSGLPVVTVILLGLLAGGAAGRAADAAGYATTFPQAEQRLSESGRWIDGRRITTEWGYVSTTPHYAVGHAAPARYADAVALLAGEWPADQGAEVTVEKRAVRDYPEVEIRLRSTLAPHRCDGYEVTFSLKDDDTAYLIIVRWNGPLGDFTYLLNVHGRQYAAKSGDVLRATIVGHTIRACKNGVLTGTATDDRFSGGAPGFGFNEQDNGDYGITRFATVQVAER